MSQTYPSSAPSPDYALSAKVKPRIVTARFGDGYAQRSRDGLNNIDRTWDVRWTDLSLDELEILTDFFELCAGVDNFAWTPPGEQTAVKVIVEEWDKEWGNVGRYNLRASFIQDFRP
jgi:phage-related protein